MFFSMVAFQFDFVSLSILSSRSVSNIWINGLLYCTCRDGPHQQKFHYEECDKFVLYESQCILYGFAHLMVLSIDWFDHLCASLCVCICDLVYSNWASTYSTIYFHIAVNNNECALCITKYFIVIIVSGKREKGKWKGKEAIEWEWDREWWKESRAQATYRKYQWLYNNLSLNSCAMNVHLNQNSLRIPSTYELDSVIC